MSLKSKAILIPGTELQMGAHRLVCPALSLGALETLRERLVDWKGGIDTKNVATVVDSAHAALSRNYPEITREEILDMIDLRNMRQIMEAIMGISGLTEVSAPPAGEQ